MTGGEKDFSEFLDRYLAHIERKDSREGVTKWVLVAAMAALAWQLIGVLEGIDLASAWALLSVLLLLCFVVERASELLRFDTSDYQEAKFFARGPTRPADASYISAVLARSLLTLGLALYVFTANFDLVGKIRVPVGMILAPLLIFALALSHLLFEVRQKYLVRKSTEFGLATRVVVLLIFVLSPAIGLYWLNDLSGLVSRTFKQGGTQSYQFSALCLGLMFLAEKYARLLRADGEAAAIRKIWRKLGLNEIDQVQAHQEMKLIVAGASLSEVIRHDVNRFIVIADEIDALAARTDEELSTLIEGESSAVVRAALRNSIDARAASVGTKLGELKKSADSLVKQGEKMLGVHKDDAVQSLKEELEVRVKQASAAHAKLLSRIAALDA